MHSPLAKLAVIGGGNMGSAIVRGGMATGVLVPGEVMIAEPDAAKRRALTDDCGVTASAGEALGATAGDGMVLLAIKPQVFPGVVEALDRAGGVGGRLVISIMAGVTIQSISRSLKTTKIVRAMPNLPASVSKGITAIAAGSGTSPADLAKARSLFRAVGQAMELEEDLFDAFTGVAGSGPAYVFLLAEAMERAAIELGIDGALAPMIVRETIAGAAELLLQRSVPPGELKSSVTSRGGTTAAALAVLDAAGVTEAVVRAIVAARDRGRELGKVSTPS